MIWFQLFGAVLLVVASGLVLRAVIAADKAPVAPAAPRRRSTDHGLRRAA